MSIGYVVYICIYLCVYMTFSNKTYRNRRAALVDRAEVSLGEHTDGSVLQALLEQKLHADAVADVLVGGHRHEEQRVRRRPLDVQLRDLLLRSMINEEGRMRGRRLH